MAKKRTMNELRQTKDTHYINPSANKAWTVEDQKEYHSGKGKDIAGDEFMLKQAKDLIVNELQDRFYDVIFQAVADEMNKNYMFRQNNYLTEAGEELFEDAWFEWYHEQHGEILSRILKTLEP